MDNEKLAQALEKLAEKINEMETKVQNLILSSTESSIEAKTREKETEELRDENSRLQEAFDNAPKSIGDFPAQERAEYFMEFIKSLSPEDKILLAEKCGWSFTETASPQNVPVDNKPVDQIMRFVIKDQPVTIR